MAQNHYKELTNKIIKCLEGNNPPWQQPWTTCNSLPINAESKRAYRGVNIFSLWMSQEMYRYSTNLWGTEAMWKRLGGSVLDGQHPTQVYLFRRIQTTDPVTKMLKWISILSTFDVYNLDQIWGALLLRKKINRVITKESDIDFQPAEKLAKRMKVKTFHNGRAAFYNNFSDTITLPPKTKFHSQIGYWNTHFHELVHATGHAKRLKRDFYGYKGPGYAFEELIAEIGTTFICSMIGLPQDEKRQLQQHASYIKSWLKILKDDEKAIFRASTAAQKAADFIMGKKIDSEEDVE